MCNLPSVIMMSYLGPGSPLDGDDRMGIPFIKVNCKSLSVPQSTFEKPSLYVIEYRMLIAGIFNSLCSPPTWQQVTGCKFG